MNKKTLIISILAAMVVMIVAAKVIWGSSDGSDAPVEDRYRLAYAVPSNAVVACFLSDASELSLPVLSSFDFHRDLAGFLKSDAAGSLSEESMAVSLHYSGYLTPLYVFDAGKSDDITEEAAALIGFAQERGYHAEFVNVSELNPDGPLSSHSVVLVAQTKAQIRISKSHLKEGRSVMDAVGFLTAAESAPADVMFFSYEHAKILFEKAVLRSYYKSRFGNKASSEFSDAASFFKSMAGWGVVALDDRHSYEMFHTYDSGSDFMSVMNHEAPSYSQVSQMLPCYTVFAFTLPMNDAGAYIGRYAEYLESVQKNGVNQKWQTRLKKKTGVLPDVMIDRWGVTEVATAAFECGGELEWVNLLKVENADTVLLRGTGRKSFGKKPEVYPYAFAESIASVFGRYFRLEDESHFTYMNGWLITGSRRAVEEYVGGMALAYDLKTYMSDAEKEDMLAEKPATAVAYLNAPKGNAWFNGLVGKELCGVYDALKGDAGYAPLMMHVYADGQTMHTDMSCPQLEHVRSRAPKFNRDTVVTVPAGPFSVMNSVTGRTNLFYQRANGAISLKEDDGKGIWGVPFKKKLSGRAVNVDYHGNGNLQILFGAGSELYIIDMSGRFVGGFPVGLGKDILLGPDVYDFNGDNSYSVLVLHKDNTVEMYDLRGQKPQSWKGIVPPVNNTIKSLPERLTVGDKDVWVVRTSMQTLIYPFEGGSPLNSLEGDKMILPTAEIQVKNETTLEGRCYDGKTRTVKIK